MSLKSSHGREKFPLRLSELAAPQLGFMGSNGQYSEVNTKHQLHNSNRRQGGVSEHVFICTHSSLEIFPSDLQSWTKKFPDLI